jgi:DNA helicase-2/ATP-dependent DNA helicase PcrA
MMPPMPAADDAAHAALNPAQREAAQSLSGPVLVVAGAGTGKTRTLVHRLVALIRAGVPGESILLLNFTRRAAQEMIDRATALLHEQAPGRVSGGTFHGFANLMLRRFGEAIGLPRDYTILDQADSFEILAGLRTDLKVGRGFPRRETIAAILSRAVNESAAIADVVKAEWPHFLGEVPRLSQIASHYAAYKRQRRLLDYDDLLSELVRLLSESPPARARITDRYRYVMVDEYQDTNFLQARITRLLSGPERNLMVVGDDAQSIYGFRGARYDNLFDFHKEYKDARVITLEQNYRSTQPILDLGNAVLNQMPRTFRKRLHTSRPGGSRPLLIDAMDEEEQAKVVLHEVRRHRQAGVPLSQIAVLFRASSHSFALELELSRHKIPYVKYGGFRFMEAAHIKDVLAYLRVLHNPADDLSLGRVLKLYEGIGQAGARRICQALAHADAHLPLHEALAAYPAKGVAKKGLQPLISLYGSLAREGLLPAARLAIVIEHYTPILKLCFDDWHRRQKDLEQLLAMCQGYRSLESLLTDMAIQPPTSAAGDNLTDDADGRLVLSTMHSAKGLEWQVVFIIGARDGWMPMFSSFGPDPEPDAIGEELRLFYVAATRAKDVLYVLWPRSTQRGGFGFDWPEVSRFVQAMPQGLFDRHRGRDVLRGAD